MLFYFFSILSLCEEQKEVPAEKIPAEIKLADATFYGKFDEKTLAYTFTRKSDDTTSILSGSKLTIKSASVEYQKKTLKISSIAPNAFKGSDIVKVEISIPLESIGEGAFEDCSKLSSVTLDGTSLSLIPSRTFANCNLLSSVVLPNTIKTIGDAAFSCTKLSEFKFPSTLTTIGHDAFEFNQFTEIDFSKSKVEKIGYHAFYNNTKLKNIKFGNSLKTISGSAFSCTAIEELKVDAAVTRIMKSAFAYCNLMKSADLTSTKIEVLDEFVFTKCTSLTEIKLPSTVTSIGSCALSETDLTEFVVPKSVSKLGQAIFRNCPRLATVDLSACKVSNVPVAIFTKCIALAKVIFPENCTVIEKLAFSYSGISTIDLPSTLTLIGEGAFRNCAFLQSIDLSNTALKKASAFAFAGCSTLNSVTFPEKMPEFGDYSFSDTAFTKLVVGNEMKSAGRGVYANCKKLEEVDLTNIELESVPASMFENCSSLREIKWPDFQLAISERSFYGTAITTLEMPSTISFISASTFQNCTKLTKISLSDIMFDELPMFAFANCSSLSQVEFPSSSIRILKGVFAGTAIREITFPKTFASVGESAFEGCKQLEKVNLQDTMIEIIPKSVFKDCTNLKQVTWPGQKFSVGEESFANSGLEMLEIPGNLVKLEKKAFANCHFLSNVNMNGNNLNISSYCFSGCDSLNTFTWSGSECMVGDYALSYTGFRQFAIPEKLAKVGVGLLFGCSFLETLDISKCSFTEIPEKFCCGCERLTTIQIESGSAVKIFGPYSFCNCTSLSNFNFVGSVRKLDKGSFMNTNFSTIKFPSNIHEIEVGGFANCQHLQRIDLNDSNVCLLCPHSFTNCFKLREIIFPHVQTAILSYGFESCGFVDLTIPKEVTYIGAHAFENCPNLVSVNMSSLVMTRILPGLFTNCSNLYKVLLSPWTAELCREVFRGTKISEVIYDEKMEVIEPGVFMDCKELISVDISRTKVTNISARTFMNCERLVRVMLPDCVKQLHTMCFCNTPMESFKCPRSLVVIGWGAFLNSSLKTYEMRGVQEIQDCAFEGCPIDKLVLPRTSLKIGARAFARTNLKDFSIPANVYEIGQRCFMKTKANKVDMQMSNIIDLNLNLFEGTKIKKLVLPNYLQCIDGEAPDCDIYYCGEGPIDGYIVAKSLTVKKGRKIDIVVKNMIESEQCPSL